MSAKEMKTKVAAKIAAGAVTVLAVFSAGYSARSVQVDHQPEPETLAVPRVCLDLQEQERLTCIYDWHSIVHAADAAAGNAQ